MGKQYSTLNKNETSGLDCISQLTSECTRYKTDNTGRNINDDIKPKKSETLKVEEKDKEEEEEDDTWIFVPSSDSSSSCSFCQELKSKTNYDTVTVDRKGNRLRPVWAWPIAVLELILKDENQDQESKENPKEDHLPKISVQFNDKDIKYTFSRDENIKNQYKIELFGSESQYGRGHVHVVVMESDIHLNITAWVPRPHSQSYSTHDYAPLNHQLMYFNNKLWWTSKGCLVRIDSKGDMKIEPINTKDSKSLCLYRDEDNLYLTMTHDTTLYITRIIVNEKYILDQFKWIALGSSLVVQILVVHNGVVYSTCDGFKSLFYTKTHIVDGLIEKVPLYVDSSSSFGWYNVVWYKKGQKFVSTKFHDWGLMLMDDTLEKTIMDDFGEDEVHPFHFMRVVNHILYLSYYNSYQKINLETKKVLKKWTLNNVDTRGLAVNDTGSVMFAATKDQILVYCEEHEDLDWL